MYPLVFRHVLARFDPEFAHHLGMAVIRVAGTWPVRPLVHRFTRPAPELAVEALGQVFPSPFGVAAGFDKNAVGVRGLEALGFGHVEIGTVTAVPQDGNPKPRLFRLIQDRAVVNRMGFNNRGAEAAARRLARLRRTGAVVGANIGKSRVVDVADATADYVKSARMLAPLADYLAVNVSSPNTPGLRGLQAVETLAPLLRAVREAAGATPLLVKIAPDLPDDEIQAIARLAVDEGLAGIIATNTTISREGLATDAATVEAAGAGGLSGAPLKARSLEVLRTVRAAVPDDFCVVSVGGVETAEEVQERLDAGATLVQGYTAFLYRGPLWACEINAGLSAIRAAR
ncbi:dihydroorotate dehydrogenase (quinone) [Microbacterium sp. Root53]|jgi:dihydroorotate dehydrogenase|uniref:quinone-dependent dihydroorotate dehydrogenase n=1 Tax=Microbacterium sp. Root53 TaxID=1736553 RepID=UPI0006F48FC2|nr:quinone-dependent dihydroorotate dehydrogenase [Microbacterium sp. Root53]KQY98780.1 dihydroorotate dehydrogenase (quinone) [Microbacterium sp. Root53]